ncbi:MAG: EF-hand domain-containing protein, partial [Candidatus Hydrogenedentes bacterium]|nr:EF-hand domain-containing protein [Candidatus Hydrogenedentota bacterium]
MRIYARLLLALAIAVALVAWAARPADAAPVPAAPQEPAGRLRQMDNNGDGQVTFEEVLAVHPGATRDRFDRMDRNGDGVLSKADRPDGTPGQGPGSMTDKMALLKKADADQNGTVTFEELSAVMPQMTRERFARIDRNGDGVLTKEDRPAGEPGQGPGGMTDKMALLKKADADQNG